MIPTIDTESFRSVLTVASVIGLLHGFTCATELSPRIKISLYLEYTSLFINHTEG